MTHTDEYLAASLAGDHGLGPQRAANYLKELPTEELRDRAVARAHLRMNLSGGWIYSAAVYEAVKETKVFGLAETLDEAYARSIRELENRRKGYGPTEDFSPGDDSSYEEDRVTFLGE